MFDFGEELKKLPDKPGVYIMRSAADEIIYIGKARDLKKRVRQYFDASRKKSPKIEKMVAKIARFEYIVTDSEVEALILENNLIKENRPRYNTMLKDDKTYPYIRLTSSENYPRLVLARKVKKDGDRYYGPYPTGSDVKDVIDLLNRVYRLRTCRGVFPRDFGKRRPCLNYHIGKCRGVCTGSVSEDEYARGVAGARRFLEGHPEEVSAYLKNAMREASRKMEYEEAARLRDLTEHVKTMCERQKMEYDPGDNRDVLGLASDGTDAIVQVFFIRSGKLTDRELFYLSAAPGESRAGIISSFVKQYYSGTPYLPSEVHIPEKIDDGEAIEKWLCEKAARKVSLITPKKGRKEKLVELAERNARIALEKDREKAKREEARTRGAVREISRMLGINYARRVESYDISNTSGYESVGSMVVFEDGKPKKNDYRKFRIKTVKGPDDCASMAEVIERRFSHAEWPRPDLLLIDGGKGQVNAVKKALGKNSGVPVCGMVKDDRHRTRGLIYENKEYIMDSGAETFRLITRIQDETHRFAIEYHKLLRAGRQVRSILDDIPGIGKKRRLALIRQFKSVDGIKEAGVDELSAVPGMNRSAAQAVVDFFSGK